MATIMFESVGNVYLGIGNFKVRLIHVGPDDLVTPLNNLKKRMEKFNVLLFFFIREEYQFGLKPL